MFLKRQMQYKLLYTLIYMLEPELQISQCATIVPNVKIILFPFIGKIVALIIQLKVLVQDDGLKKYP